LNSANVTYTVIIRSNKRKFLNEEVCAIFFSRWQNILALFIFLYQFRITLSMAAKKWMPQSP